MKQDSSLHFQKSPALPFVEMRRANASSACFQTHSHDEFSFGVIDAGTSIYQNQRQHYDINPGDSVTINPGDAHSCNPKQAQWSYRMLFVDTQWVGRCQQELLGGQADYQPFDWDYSQSPSVRNSFNSLYQYLTEADNALAAESQLMAYFAGCFQPRLANRSVMPADFPKAELIRQILHDELAANHSLDRLVTETGLSRSHLVRSFKQRYGQSPHAYQLDQRIKKAKQLLRQGQRLPDIALQLGFSDQAHFQRHFKRRLAVTPKQYQSFFVG